MADLSKRAGHLLFKDGHLATGCCQEGCHCDCASDLDCSGVFGPCAGCTCRTITAVFSGVDHTRDPTPCNACNYGYVFYLSGNINHTFTLTQRTDFPCVWDANPGAGVVSFRVYSQAVGNQGDPTWVPCNGVDGADGAYNPLDWVDYDDVYIYFDPQGTFGFTGLFVLLKDLPNGSNLGFFCVFLGQPDPFPEFGCCGSATIDNANPFSANDCDLGGIGGFASLAACS